jgi:aspartyl/asparaginyl beta-hydroxylase (cupin superfamily)
MSGSSAPNQCAVEFEPYDDVKEFSYEEPPAAFFAWREIFPQLGAILEEGKDVLEEVGSPGRGSWFEWPQHELWKRPGNSWEVLPLVGFGRRMVDNLAAFPVLARLLARLPGLRTAIFSRLGPRTSIRPHRGPFALSSNILRCHFGIRAPEPSGVWVRGEFRQQRVGEWLVFDDLCLHSGVNEHASEPKIVLLLDLARPDFARPASWPRVAFPTAMPPGWEPVLEHVGAVEDYDPESW